MEASTTKKKIACDHECTCVKCIEAFIKGVMSRAQSAVRDKSRATCLAYQAGRSALADELDTREK